MAGTITAVLAFASAVLHIVTLQLSGLDWATTPIAELSRTRFGNLQNLGLMLFVLAHLSLAFGLGRAGTGALWLIARIALVLTAAAIVAVAVAFAAPDVEVESNSIVRDPLSAVATLMGVAMALLLPGLKRTSRALWLLNLAMLGVWLTLAVLLLLADAHWLGAYERIVGVVYTAWLVGFGLGLSRFGLSRPDQSAAPPATRDR